MIRRTLAVTGLFALALVGIAGAQIYKGDPPTPKTYNGQPAVQDWCKQEPTLAPCLESRIAALEKDRDDLKRRVAELEKSKSAIKPIKQCWVPESGVEGNPTYWHWTVGPCPETRVLHSKEKP